MNADGPKEPLVLTPRCLTQPRFRAAVARGFTAAEREHIDGCAWCARVEAAFRTGAASARADGPRPDRVDDPLDGAVPFEVRPRAWVGPILSEAARRAEPKDYAVFDLVVLKSKTFAEAAALLRVSLAEAFDSYRAVLAAVAEAARDARPTVREAVRGDPLGQAGAETLLRYGQLT